MTIVIPRSPVPRSVSQPDAKCVFPMGKSLVCSSKPVGVVRCQWFADPVSVTYAVCDTHMKRVLDVFDRYGVPQETEDAING